MDKTLSTYTIKEGTKWIGSYAFQNHTNLISIVIPNSVISIGERAFRYCSGLTSVTIGNSVTSIGEEAFYDCYCLASVTIGNSVTSIGEHAFYYCYGLKSVTIPNSVTSIGNSAFYGCSSLTSVTIPNSVTNLGGYSFSGCSGLKSVVIGNSVKYIGSYSFSGCSSLTSVTIGDSVTTICDYAFTKCSSLQSITIPNSVTTIYQYAFSDTELKSITIGTGVTYIGSLAFGTRTKTIWLTNTPPSGYKYAAGTVNYVSNNNYSSLTNVKVYSYLSSIFEVDGVKYVPVKPSERTCDAIDCTYNGNEENINVGETVSYKHVTLNVQNINDYAFYENTYIKNATISCNGAIGSYAFNGCSNLENVTISCNGDVGSYAFNGCSNLENATITNNGAVSNYAFANCSNLQSATLGMTVTELGNYSFSKCSKLNGIIIPGSVSSIGQYAFNGCTSMKDVELNDGLQYVQQYAFYCCNKIDKISIPKTVDNIYNYAFSGCSSLSTVSFEDRESTLILGSNGNNPLFYSCPLDSVYIGGKISYPTSSDYGYSPFYRNTKLRSVFVTNEETNIYANEFYGCTGLKNITLGDGVTSIGYRAFSGCSSLESFTFGSNMQSIEEEAFSDCANVTSIISKTAVPPTCGTQALDDINKWDCILMVPEDDISAYQAADQWKDFFFVEGGSTLLPNVFVVDKYGQKADIYVNPGSLYTIIDSNKNFKVQDNIDNVDISYSRVFDNTNWQCWYVPFDLELTNEILNDFSFAIIDGTVYSEDDTPYLAFVKAGVGDIIKAHTPYVVKALTADENNPQSISVASATLKKTADKGFSINSSRHIYTFTGFYSQKTAQNGDTWYTINNSGSFMQPAEDVTINPFRFSMTITNRADSPYPVKALPHEVKIRVEGETTDIDFVEMRNEELKMKNVNLAGQIVGNDYKGITIRNGKKYLTR